MIGKIIIGKSFRGCILYCLNDKISAYRTNAGIKNRAEVLMYNKCFGDQKELIRQFIEVRQLNDKLSKSVMHITLSLAPGENLSKDKLMEMVQQCAIEIGFANNQYLGILHNDTNHQHVHIIANRVGYDRRTVRDSNSYQKIASFCRKMELKYHLQQVLNPNRYLSKEQRLVPRNDQRKDQIKDDIRQALHDSRFYYEFQLKMKEKGYQLIKGRGISFIDERKVRVKGSELNYSLQTIERIIERNRSFELSLAQDRFDLQDDKSQSMLSNKKQGPNQPVGIEKTGALDQPENSAINNLINDLSTIVLQVTKPDEPVEQNPKELLKKKKQRKRRQPRHL